MTELNLEIFADYHQFHLHDEQLNPDFVNIWNDFYCENLLAFDEKGIGISTARNMDVPVNIKIFDIEPENRKISDTLFQIIEIDLKIISGNLVVIGCTDYLPTAKRIKLDIGIYRVRIYYYNLDKISLNGLEGEDKYDIEIWKTDKSTKPKFKQLKKL